MSNQVAQSGTPIILSSSGTISKASGNLIGFYVSSTTSGTIVILSGADGASSGTAISGTITPGTGFHAFPAYCPAGAYATLANTISVTFFFAA